MSWGSKIKPLIWKDQRNRVTWSSHRHVCVCVFMASDSARFQWRRRHQKAVTYTHKCRCTSFVQQVIPLQSWPPRNLHIHTLHILLQQHAILCLAPSHLHSSVNSPYYITMHMHAQTQAAAEQCRSTHAHQHTPLHSQHEFWYPFEKGPLSVCMCVWICS